MHKIAHEVVYLCHDVFVPTLRSSSSYSIIDPLLIVMHFLHSYVPKTCSSWNNQIKLLVPKFLSVFKSPLINHMYHVNGK